MREVRRMVNVARLTAGAGAVLLSAAGLIAWGIAERRPDLAAQAAVQQLEARSGRTDVTVSDVAEWQDCAIVSLSTGGRYGPNIAMKVVGSQWVTGRSTEEDDVGFDLDDIDSRRACLAVANSTGPLANGAPD